MHAELENVAPLCNFTINIETNRNTSPKQGKKYVFGGHLTATRKNFCDYQTNFRLLE